MEFQLNLLSSATILDELSFVDIEGAMAGGGQDEEQKEQRDVERMERLRQEEWKRMMEDQNRGQDSSQVDERTRVEANTKI